MGDIDGHYIMLGIVIAFAVLLLMVHHAGFLFHDHHQSAETKRRKFINQRLASGLSIEDVLDECAMREALAHLREVCSDHVRTNGPQGWEEVLKLHIKAHVTVLSSRNPKLGKRFIEWMYSLEHSDILYPHEYEMLRPLSPAVKVPEEVRHHITRIKHAAYTDL